MNKLLTKIAGLTLGLTMAIGVGVAAFSTADGPVGVHAEINERSIVFVSHTSDSSSAATSLTANNLVESNNLVHSVSFTKVYAGKQGAKLGSSSANGSMTLNLLEEAKTNVKKVTFNVAKYGSDTGTFTFKADGTNLKTGFSPSSTTYVHEFSSATTINSLEAFTSAKRAYVKSIIVTYESSSGGSTEGTPILEGITVNATKTQFNVGDTFSFEGTVNANYSNGDSIDVTDETEFSGYNMSVAGTQTVTATYKEVSSTYDIVVSEAVASVYSIVKDVSSLSAGDTIVIAAKNSNYAISTTQNSNNRAGATITKNGDNATLSSDVQLITLEAGSKDGTFAFKVNDGYLYAASSSNNYLRTQSKIDDNASWKITISNQIATITAQGGNTRNIMKYNSQSYLFSCYSSGQADVCIYKREVVSESIDIENININNDSTINLEQGKSVELDIDIYPAEATESYTITSSDTNLVVVVGTTITASSMNTGNGVIITVASKNVAKTITVNVTPAPLFTIKLSEVNNKFVLGKPISYHFTETSNIIHAIYGTGDSGANKVREEVIEITDTKLSITLKDGTPISFNDLVTEDFAMGYILTYTVDSISKSKTYNGITITSGVEITGETKQFTGSKDYIFVDDKNSRLNLSFTSHWGEISMDDMIFTSSNEDVIMTDAELSTVDFDSTTKTGTISISLDAIDTGSAYIEFLYYAEIDGNEIEVEYCSQMIVVKTEGAGGDTQSDKYVKVTSDSDLTDGKYLIVYEAGSLVLNGSLIGDDLDAVNNSASIKITDGTIESNTIVDSYSFTISSITDGKSIQSSSGYYIGQTSDGNDLKTSTSTKYINTISIDSSGNADIVSKATHLRYNPTSGQTRFRYYKSSTYTDQKAVQLFKFVEAQVDTNNDFEVVLNFVETYMHPEINMYDKGTNLCVDYYADARNAFNDLTTSQQSIFVEKFPDMFLRLQAWAIANGETIEYDPSAETYVIKNTNNSLMTINNSFDSTLLILFACISFVSITAIVIVRKRKEQ